MAHVLKDLVEAHEKDISQLKIDGEKLSRFLEITRTRYEDNFSVKKSSIENYVNHLKEFHNKLARFEINMKKTVEEYFASLVLKGLSLGDKGVLLESAYLKLEYAKTIVNRKRIFLLIKELVYELDTIIFPLAGESVHQNYKKAIEEAKISVIKSEEYLAEREEIYRKRFSPPEEEEKNAPIVS